MPVEVSLSTITHDDGTMKWNNVKSTTIIFLWWLSEPAFVSYCLAITTYNGASKWSQLTLVLSVYDHRGSNGCTIAFIYHFCMLFSLVHTKFQQWKVVKFQQVHLNAKRWESSLAFDAMIVLDPMQNISINISHHQRIVSFHQTSHAFFLSFPFEHFSVIHHETLFS